MAEGAEELCPSCVTYKAGAFPPYHCDVCRGSVQPIRAPRCVGLVRDDAPPYLGPRPPRTLKARKQ